MKEIYVEQIQPGDRITDYFALRKSELKEKDGRFRLALEFGDATGRIGGVMWDATPEMGRLYQPGKIVKIRGMAGSYMDQPQIRVEKIRLATEDEYDLGDYFRKGTKTRDELENLLNGNLDRLENTWLKQLMTAVFDDDLREKYLTSPAAKLLHHDFIGGLAEHSLSMAEIVIRMADNYPKLDRDLLICGALLHDIGKIWEYEVKASIDFSTVGRLVGHITIGDEFLVKRAETIENFPPELLTHLRHLIVSHQGEKMKGSPVVPMTPEAVFLHHCDELDARMGMIEKIRDRTGDGDWSEYSRIMERFFYFGFSDDEAGDEEEAE